MNVRELMEYGSIVTNGYESKRYFSELCYSLIT